MVATGWATTDLVGRTSTTQYQVSEHLFSTFNMVYTYRYIPLNWMLSKPESIQSVVKYCAMFCTAANFSPVSRAILTHDWAPRVLGTTGASPAIQSRTKITETQLNTVKTCLRGHLHMAATCPWRPPWGPPNAFYYIVYLYMATTCSMRPAATLSIATYM